MTFLSVETTRDELVLVDAETGSVTTLGTIDTDMRDPDLAVVGGILYAVNSLYTDGFAQILSLDAGGNILSLDTLEVAGVPVSHSEGLADIDGELWASFHFSSSSPTSSDALGRLSLTGELTEIVSFVDIDSLADGDGLCRNPFAEVLWLDVTPPGLDTRQLIDVSRPPESLFQQHTLRNGYSPVNDLEFNAAGDSLWGIAGDGFLRLIEYPSFTILDSVQYDNGNTLVGLTRSDIVTSVPNHRPGFASQVAVYPNPATDRLVFDLPEHGQAIHVTIYDAGGRRVWSGRSPNSRLIWNLESAAGSPVSAGVYFVAVSSASERFVRRVAILR